MADKSTKILFLETFAGLITAAFGLIAALAWNEAIKAIILEFFKAGNAITGLFIYAIIVTIIAVLATLIIARALSKVGAEVPKQE
ncbi:MAG: hypothetical protein CIT01_09655 [Methanobacterium sp. BRmetb2]|nr:MAG: hypothetical protein CIT01_09655 [Methanobacterium sp. BRmetb2]